MILYLHLCKANTLFTISSSITTITSDQTSTINVMTLSFIKAESTRLVTVQTKFTFIALCKINTSEHFIKSTSNQSTCIKRNKNLLRVSQVTPFHPTWHPPSHCPVTLSHLYGTPQLTLHCSWQLQPYRPSGQSILMTN